MTFRAPKYSCTICGKVFRRNKQHFNHVMRGHKNNSKRQQQTQVSVTYVTMQPSKYYGREYHFNPIPTGNRHLRAGIPLPRLNPNMRCAI